MITCSVCGGLNNPNNAVCQHCGSDLIDESEAMNLFYDNDDNDTSFFDSSDDDSGDSNYIDDDDDYEDY
ncbi:hypothetical protein [Methanobrevibacter millerae]|jgi:hypothetical protein|uniref:Zinc-ribbon domain-containing protein n=1 Tax=Methanobrevibacter millerae TaxID=230361 RepID=A0A0U3E9K6_9EURY|nr:hypothetical protein [Methanobrevibacter millerae]ALT69016.1 hypothetical protein sm9_1235 [Methanobrevibacter millerae]